MKKNNGSPCGVLFGVALLAAGAYIVYKIVVFLKKPDALARILEFIEAIGLCIGAGIVFLIVVGLVGSLSSSIKSRFRRQSKVFAGQADTRFMLPFDRGPIPEDLPEAPNQVGSLPISVNLVMTNYGLWITTDDPKEKEPTTDPPDEAGASKSFLDEFSNSIIIPINCINLYYLVYHGNGCMESEPGPGKSPGFKDRIPELSEGDSLQIVMVFGCILERDSLRQAVRLKQPVKMKLVVQDQDGNDDLPATFTLYELIYERKREAEAQDDDSWMYRSRPMYW